MDVDIISPKLLLKDFFKSIEGYKGLFFVVPIAIGIVMCLFLKGENKNAVEGFINSSLTSFVPIFATILSVYISWVFTKRSTRHEKERVQIFQETTNEIFVLIPLVLFAISAYFISHLSISQYLKFIPYIHQICKCTRCVIDTIYYGLFIEIVLVIFMITKRSYIIIMNEIRLLEANK